MTKILISLACVLLILGLSLGVCATPGRPGAPTAPPPPRATNTTAHIPPRRSTGTPKVPPTSSWRSRTPTASASTTLTDTPASTNTLTPTLTMTPTLTPSLTPTPRLNLHVVVYLDSNQNGLFESGEGVNELLLIVNSGSWMVQGFLQNGEAWLALPDDLLPGDQVQVQIPYLHWSAVLHAPKPGEILNTSLRLELPQYPVSLP